MNAVVSKIARRASPAANSNSDASDDIKSRYSPELVVALSGPVGAGVQHVQEVLIRSLREHGYEVVPIKISSAFSDLSDKLGVAGQPTDAASESNRISRMQDLGNSLRSILGDDLGAQIALDAIAHDRTARHPGVDIKDIKPGRVAYIIDQLKNPREALLLRKVYGNMFYLLGVLCGYERRKQNLEAMPMSAPDAEALIARDRAEANGGGQQLEKTLKLADFFVHNAHDNQQELKKPIDRLLGLIHGKNGITPTIIERGMYAAHSASLSSACLSRQVGAAILDVNGNIVSTGCNDVPKAGGGLYPADNADQRCVLIEGGVCFNDRHKDKVRDEIELTLREGGVGVAESKQLAQKIRSSTRLKDLIEFSRAVHAEMDALISLARKGGSGVQNCIMFTTTYPCHNCARHIVAAGISSVYFIEPYGKSLAGELHRDSIDHDPSPQRALFSDDRDRRVAFVNFEGVAPRRFTDLFSAPDSRKNAVGRAIEVVSVNAVQLAPELLDNYRELEAKIVERLKKKITDVGSVEPPRAG